MSGFSATREEPRLEPGEGIATAPRTTSKAARFFLAGCCLAMVAGFVLIVLSRVPGEPVTNTLLIAAPLAGCLAMHVAMHRFLARKCCNPNSSRKSEI
ncbi:hypothetical protein [Oricola sp.]|uniref:hypothetical protein n=1 Tax=Oricola sp. TaxID=1979950 RepID=UPI00320BC716|nr:hypothetical protein [Oricola sp.]